MKKRQAKKRLSSKTVCLPTMTLRCLEFEDYSNSTKETEKIWTMPMKKTY